MHNLMSTVECIYRVARWLQTDVNVSEEQYSNEVEVGISDKSYSIPSLIWPPPQILEVLNFSFQEVK